MVADDFVAGGAFVVAERLALGLAGAYRLTFACDFSPLTRPARARLAAAGVEIAPLFAHAGDTRRATLDHAAACALVARARPDRIAFVDSSPRSHLALKDVARAWGLPYLSIVNFVDRETPAALKRFDAAVERTAKAAAAVVFVSAAARGEFAANYPGVTAPLRVVANGVPDAFFAPADPVARADLRAELGIGEDEVMLLLPGRLEPRKGQGLALAALAALGEGPRLRLVLAGFGDAQARSALQAQIRALGLEDRVAYLGPRDDMPRLLDACEIVAMPSAQEADPLVAKEAMARGKPVVASDLPGVREQGHAEALLVPAPDEAPEATARALAAVLDRLRRDPDLRAREGERLRALAERRFGLAQMADAYRSLLDALPARGSAPAPGEGALPLDRWLECGQAASLFKDGWADFEPEGVWSLGSQARLAFRLPEPAREVEIAFEVRTLAAPARPRAFEIVANGRSAATWNFGGDRREKRMLRVVLPRPKRLFVLRLRGAPPPSPFDLGLNEDRRPLGLFVSRLRIRTRPDWTARLAGFLPRGSQRR